MKAGQVKAWLAQGPAVLISECAVEGDLLEGEDCGHIFRKNPANPDATHCGAGYLWDAEDICEQA